MAGESHHNMDTCMMPVCVKAREAMAAREIRKQAPARVPPPRTLPLRPMTRRPTYRDRRG